MITGITCSNHLGCKDLDSNRNHLTHEKSPYLLLHSKNPVNWYPWGDEAFERAKRENKPIFLSIGYSTCHWCHVMMRESFEDPEVAKLMNETFISIKVDREERPDIDHIYMKVAALQLESTGWPLNVIMTPDKKPFYVATYIPKNTRFNHKGMLELIPQIKKLWKSQKGDLLKYADIWSKKVKVYGTSVSGDDLDEPTLKKAYQELSKGYDPQYGGFSVGRKFPTPHRLLFLLRYWKRTGDKKALNMVEKTLDAMSLGGIYDHVGYGFHRYSVDREWLVPHFEKMLYDQAFIALAYIEAYQATGKTEYQRMAKEIFTYVSRDMTSPEGAFYSAENAESEGVEGKSYLWNISELKKILSKGELKLITRVYNINSMGNLLGKRGEWEKGVNIFYRTESFKKSAQSLGLNIKVFKRRLDKVIAKLLKIRNKRVLPHKDDKVLTDWNGMMIASLAKGSRVFNEPLYAEKAKKAADFILQKMDKEKGLLHRYRLGEAGILAYADDYAFLIWGLIELYETTFEIKYLQKALELNDKFIKHHWDKKNGGFYFTSEKGENLLFRSKESYDGAIPSSNSLAMLNLIRLARMTGNTDLEEKASQTGKAFSKTISVSPSSYTQWMVALDFAIGPSYEVVITGRKDSKDTKDMIKALTKPFIPNHVVLFRPSEEKSPEITKLAEFTKYQLAINKKATAYVCLKFNCKEPTTSIQTMLKLLGVK
ncbi:MAG TPA: thioredoxin domain-containing protein [Spirochaetes bacterium]|nr:thioredoxin domain-containing protein [Spirochaetota bacterium]